MAIPTFLEEQSEETRLIIEELLEDGSDPDALYTIEHHLSSPELSSLEQAAQAAFNLGYEVTEHEEIETEDGSILLCCDVISESALNAERIDEQVAALFAIAEKYAINYDGWGTYFEDPEGSAEDDEDDDGKRH